MNPAVPTGRQPWVAVVLALFCTGLGHIYSGALVTGLVLFLASLLFAPVAVLAALLHTSTPVLIGLLLAAAAVLGLTVYSIFGAYATARRRRDHYETQDYNRGIVYALFILVGLTYPLGTYLYLRANVFEAFFIPTASEVPNFLPGDRILVNKLTLHTRFPRRGDVVVFHNPRQRHLTWIKRVVALPGDVVAVRAGEVFVNGKKLERDRVPAENLAALGPDVQGQVYAEVNAGSRYLVMIDPEAKVEDFAEQKVPEGSCFVLGDNRTNSTDSRQLGFVPLGEVFGLAQYNYYPARTWARFGAAPGS